VVWAGGVDDVCLHCTLGKYGRRDNSNPVRSGRQAKEKHQMFKDTAKRPFRVQLEGWGSNTLMI